MPPERPPPHVAASWNVAPTAPLPIVRYDAKDHRHSYTLNPQSVVSRRERRWQQWMGSVARRHHLIWA